MNLSWLPTCARPSFAMVGALAVETAREPAKKGTLLEITANRHDVTESPFTVDVRHMPVETGPVSDTRNPEDEEAGSLALPVAGEIDPDWGGGEMTVLGIAHSDSWHPAVGRNTLTFGEELTLDLGGELELASATGDKTRFAAFDGGITRKIGCGLRLHDRANEGISRGAPELMVFAGLSRRF